VKKVKSNPMPGRLSLYPYRPATTKLNFDTYPMVFIRGWWSLASVSPCCFSRFFSIHGEEKRIKLGSPL